MDYRSSFNLLYADPVREMHINLERIRASEIMIKGFTPRVWTRSIGSITLDIVFGTPKKFRREGLIFEIAPSHSYYHALLGQPTFASFDVLPCYGHLKLLMDGPKGIITVSGCQPLPPLREELTTAIAARVQTAEDVPEHEAILDKSKNGLCLIGVVDSTAKLVCTPKEGYGLHHHIYMTKDYVPWLHNFTLKIPWGIMEQFKIEERSNLDEPATRFST